MIKLELVIHHALQWPHRTKFICYTFDSTMTQEHISIYIHKYAHKYALHTLEIEYRDRGRAHRTAQHVTPYAWVSQAPNINIVLLIYSILQLLVFDIVRARTMFQCINVIIIIVWTWAMKKFIVHLELCPSVSIGEVLPSIFVYVIVQHSDKNWPKGQHTRALSRTYTYKVYRKVYTHKYRSNAHVHPQIARRVFRPIFKSL